jgi:hypothetical protein
MQLSCGRPEQEARVGGRQSSSSSSCCCCSPETATETQGGSREDGGGGGTDADRSWRRVARLPVPVAVRARAVPCPPAPRPALLLLLQLQLQLQGRRRTGRWRRVRLVPDYCACLMSGRSVPPSPHLVDISGGNQPHPQEYRQDHHPGGGIQYRTRTRMIGGYILRRIGVITVVNGEHVRLTKVRVRPRSDLGVRMRSLLCRNLSDPPAERSGTRRPTSDRVLYESELIWTVQLRIGRAGECLPQGCVSLWAVQPTGLMRYSHTRTGAAKVTHGSTSARPPAPRRPVGD